MKITLTDLYFEADAPQVNRYFAHLFKIDLTILKATISRLFRQFQQGDPVPFAGSLRFFCYVGNEVDMRLGFPP